MNYIYIVYNSDTGLTKIGITENIERRFSQIQKACGCEIDIVAWVKISHASEIEKFLHATYSQYRKHGEWFELSDREVQHLNMFWRYYFQNLNTGDDPIFGYEYMAKGEGFGSIIFDFSCYDKKSRANVD